MVEESCDWTTVFLGSGFVSLFSVRCAGGPVFPDDALPFVGQGADGGVVAAAWLAICGQVLDGVTGTSCTSGPRWNEPSRV